MKFHVPDMSCDHCTAAITKEIETRDPMARVTTDLDSHTVEVVTSQTDGAMIEAIKAAGYDATLAR